VRTADCATDVILPEGTEFALPGDNVSVQLKLADPLPIQEGKHLF
jgi:translation elongation factor EF-Tu-like GTPase